MNASEKVTVEVGIAVEASAEMTAICATIYSDVNGNARLDAGEGLVHDATMTVLDTNAMTAIGTHLTDGNEPFCFENLAAGNYRVATTLPAGWRGTTRSDWDFHLAAGSTVNLEFGAQRSPTGAAAETKTSYDMEEWLSIALVIGVTVTPFLALASLILNIIILRRLGRMQAEKPKDSASEAP